MRTCLTILVVALTGPLAACSGELETNPGVTASAGAQNLPGVPNAPGEAELTPAAPPSDSTAFLDQESAALRRLSNAEYSATLSSLLGELPGAAERFKLPPDPRRHGFDNNAELLGVSLAHAGAYGASALAVAKAALTDPARRAAIVNCDLALAGCLDSIVARLGRSVYRRPLAAEELTKLLALARQVEPVDAERALAVALEALLNSPHFLYQVAIGTPVLGRPDITRLNGYEFATRLAFLLWGSAPDEPLLDLAASGALDSPDGLAAALPTLLDDARARHGMQRFYGQWLPLERLLGPDPEGVPAVAPLAAMVEETRRFIDDVLWDSGGTIVDLLTARYSFVNGELAAIYDLPVAAGAGFQRVDFDATAPRIGLLTQPSILAATAARLDAPSSTRRGQFVRQQLLCTEIQLPPAGVSGERPEPEPGESERDAFARHTTDPTCASCHTVMDPIGWGLAEFNGLGEFRQEDSNGQPIRSDGFVQGLAEPNFNGPVELAHKLQESPQFKSCFAKQLFRFAYGRSDKIADQAGVAEFEAAFESSAWNLRAGLLALLSRDTLRFRNKGDAP